MENLRLSHHENTFQIDGSQTDTHFFVLVQKSLGQQWNIVFIFTPKKMQFLFILQEKKRPQCDFISFLNK